MPLKLSKHFKSSSCIHIILTTEDYHSQAGIYDLDISRQQRKCNVSSILLCSSCSESQSSCWGMTRSDIAASHNWRRLHIWWNREWMNEPPDKSSLILTIVHSRDAILYRLLMGIFFHSSIFHFLSAHQMAGDYNNDTLSVLNSLSLWLHPARLHLQIRPEQDKAETHIHI